LSKSSTVISGCVMAGEKIEFDHNCDLVGVRCCILRFNGMLICEGQVSPGDTFTLKSNKEMRIRVFAM
jgi:hypothetical protein